MRAFLTLSLFNLILMMSIGSSAAVPVMEGMQTVWVGDELNHNGADMKIQAFSFSGLPAQVLAFYENQWQQPAGQGQPGFIRNEAGGWQIISRFENGENQLVQVKLNSAGNSEGYLSTHKSADLMSIAGVERDLANLPIKNGSDVVSVTRSNDQGRDAITWIATNQQSVVANTRYYLDSAPRLGWHQISERSFGDVSVLLFNALKAQVEIAIHRNSRGITVVLANVVNTTNE